MNPLKFLQNFRRAFRALGPHGHGRHGRRHYMAAKINRLNREWATLQSAPRNDVRLSLRTIRARMRFLAKNSGNYTRILTLKRNNIAGPFGMKLQRAGGSDTQNKEALAHWSEWCRRENASASGKLSFTMILRRIVTTRNRDGEVLLRKIFTTNRYGYALRFFDIAWLDETYNETLPNGNRVIMSVEIDSNDRPVAYWFTTPATEYDHAHRPATKTRTRIPAAEIFHLFDPCDENFSDDSLTRGVPPGHTYSLDVFRLDRVDEASLVSQQVGASKMGFLIPPEGDEEAGEEDDQRDQKEKGPLLDHVEPGTLTELPPGYSFEAFNPDYPNQSHEPFAKYILRRIFSAAMIAYASGSGDLSDTNLSSMRFGANEERTEYKAEQETLIETFCRQNFIDWITAATLEGVFETITVKDLPKFRDPKFQPHRWPYSDPLKDVQTERLAIEAGLDTLTDSLAEQGRDLEETLLKRKAEIELARKLGVPLVAGAGTILPETYADEEPPASDKPESNKPAPAKEEGK